MFIASTVREFWWMLERNRIYNDIKKTYPYMVVFGLYHRENSVLIDEICQWLDDNCQDSYYIDWLFADVFCFKNKSDATRFKIYWTCQND